MTTYGGFLDAAVQALAVAHASLRGSAAPHPAEQVSVAASRQLLYRALRSQARVLASGGPHLAASRMVERLGRASERTSAALPLSLPAVPRGPYRRAVDSMTAAATAAADAGEILAGHVSTGAVPPARTPGGAAIINGVGREHALADLARVCRAACTVDQALARWLRPSDGGAWLPTILAARADVGVTSGLRSYFAMLASHIAPDGSYARSLTQAPLTSDPSRWTTVDSAAEAIAALEAARASLVQHPSALTAAQLRVACRSAAASTHHIGYLLDHAGASGAVIRDTVWPAAKAWRQAADKAWEMTSPVPERRPAETLTAALAAVEDWLRRRLRPDGRWLPPSAWPVDSAGTWHHTAQRLAEHLSGLADQLRDGVMRARAAGDLLVPSEPILTASSNLRWRAAEANDGAYRTLVSQLTRAHRNCARLAGQASRLSIQPAAAAADRGEFRAAQRSADPTPSQQMARSARVDLDREIRQTRSELRKALRAAVDAGSRVRSETARLVVTVFSRQSMEGPASVSARSESARDSAQAFESHVRELCDRASDLVRFAAATSRQLPSPVDPHNGASLEPLAHASHGQECARVRQSLTAMTTALDIASERAAHLLQLALEQATRRGVNVAHSLDVDHARDTSDGVRHLRNRIAQALTALRPDGDASSSSRLPAEAQRTRGRARLLAVTAIAATGSRGRAAAAVDCHALTASASPRASTELEA